MRYARRRLACEPPVIFAHRYITRPVETGGENHIAISEAEFAARLRAGLFAMHWASHGLRYGLGIEIDCWLGNSCCVVVNGSRASLADARVRYPHLEVVWIDAPPALREARLRARGREFEEQIAARMARAARFQGRHEAAAVIRNAGPLEEAGEALVALLSRSSGRASCPPSSGCRRAVFRSGGRP